MSIVSWVRFFNERGKCSPLPLFAFSWPSAADKKTSKASCWRKKIQPWRPAQDIWPFEPSNSPLERFWHHGLGDDGRISSPDVQHDSTTYSCEVNCPQRAGDLNLRNKKWRSESAVTLEDVLRVNMSTTIRQLLGENTLIMWYSDYVKNCVCVTFLLLRRMWFCLRTMYVNFLDIPNGSV